MMWSQTDYFCFHKIMGRVEQSLGHLIINSSSSHFFNKINFEQDRFEWPDAKNLSNPTISTMTSTISTMTWNSS